MKSVRRRLFNDIRCRWIANDGCGALQPPTVATFIGYEIVDGILCEKWIPDHPIECPRCGRIENQVYTALVSAQLAEVIQSIGFENYNSWEDEQ
jgi:hypothetical protein